MTGEPGKPEQPAPKPAESSARVAKRTAADAEAALRQFELDQQVRKGEKPADPVIAVKPITPPAAESAAGPAAMQPDQAEAPRRRRRRSWFQLREPVPWWVSVLLGTLCVILVFGLWWFITRGEEGEHRIVSPGTLPSPAETFGSFRELWFDRALTRNTWVTIRRVSIGFALAAVVGIPLGVMAGCFPAVNSFLLPLVIFGRNIPLAALIPLSMFMFGIGEHQKVMFIFVACVAFIVADAGTAIAEVGQKYLDTAYTLGASRWQSIIKVLVPLALPAVFNSLRLLFGLAFGYIMLAELVRMGDETGGLGNLINVSQRRGPREHIYLIIMVIPIVALAIDRLLYAVQRQLFPWRYNSAGIIHAAIRQLLGWWDDLKTSVFPPRAPFDRLAVNEGAGKSSDKGAPA